MRVSLITFLIVCCSALGQQPPFPGSPADSRLANARKQVEANGKAFQAYNELANALCRKGRDTSDLAFYRQAQAAVDRSLQLSPGNYDAVKLRVAVLLGEREFKQALSLAKEINKKGPDDIASWAFMADANAALGNYTDAEKDAQWVLDLRPGSALGFEKAAALREVFGDNEGGAEFYGEALRRTAQSDLDQRAWLITQKARLALSSGNAKGAEASLAEALQLFPDSQFAAEVTAGIRAANGETTEAAKLFGNLYKTTPSAANLYKWAAALERAGQKEQADGQFAAFESLARADMAKPYNANLELIAFYTGRKNDAAEALRVATIESGRRGDSQTLAALAWALFCNGKFPEAKAQMDKALAVGIRDAGYFCHAASIAGKVNNAADKAKFEKEAASLGAGSCAAGETMRASK